MTCSEAGSDPRTLEGGLGKPGIAQDQAAWPLSSHHSRLWGVGRPGVAQGKPGVPSGPAALPGSVWSQVEGAAPLGEGLWAPLGAVWLSTSPWISPGFQVEELGVQCCV